MLQFWVFGVTGPYVGLFLVIVNVEFFKLNAAIVNLPFGQQGWSGAGPFLSSSSWERSLQY
jgi:hypothetical protein